MQILWMGSQQRKLPGLWRHVPQMSWAKSLCTLLPEIKNQHRRKKNSSLGSGVKWREWIISTEGLYIEAIQGSSRRNIQSDLLVNDTHVTFKLDTGAECNMMSMHLASELSARIEPTSMLLKSFGGHQLDTVGTSILPTTVNGAKDSIPFGYYVIKDKVRPRLGLESCFDPRANHF